MSLKHLLAQKKLFKKKVEISVTLILVMFTCKIPEASHLNCFSIMINVSICACDWILFSGIVPDWFHLQKCSVAWRTELLNSLLLLRLWFWTTVNFRMTWEGYSWKFYQLIFCCLSQISVFYDAWKSCSDWTVFLYYHQIKGHITVRRKASKNTYS